MEMSKQIKSIQYVQGEGFKEIVICEGLSIEGSYRNVDETMIKHELMEKEPCLRYGSEFAFEFIKWWGLRNDEGERQRWRAVYSLNFCGSTWEYVFVKTRADDIAFMMTHLVPRIDVGRELDIEERESALHKL
jgi:hypothetical protein